MFLREMPSDIAVTLSDRYAFDARDEPQPEAASWVYFIIITCLSSPYTVGMINNLRGGSGGRGRGGAWATQRYGKVETPLRSWYLNCGHGSVHLRPSSSSGSNSFTRHHPLILTHYLLHRTSYPYHHLHIPLQYTYPHQGILSRGPFISPPRAAHSPSVLPLLPRPWTIKIHRFQNLIQTQTHHLTIHTPLHLHLWLPQSQPFLNLSNQPTKAPSSPQLPPNAIAPPLQRPFNAEATANVAWSSAGANISPGTSGTLPHISCIFFPSLFDHPHLHLPENTQARDPLLVTAENNFPASTTSVSMLRPYTQTSRSKTSA